MLLHGAVEGVGEVEDGARGEHGGVAGRGVVHGVEAELVGVDGVLAQLALEVAQGQVGQVVGALVGLDEVGGEGGVDVEPGERPAAGGQGQARAVGVVERLGPRRVGEPGREGRVVLGPDVGDVDPGGVALARGHGDREHLAGAGAPGAVHRHPDALPGRRVLVQPRGGLAGAEAAPVELEAGLGLGAPRRARGRWCRAAGCAARRGTPARRAARGPPVRSQGRRTSSLGTHREGQVAHQRVELAVADHVAEVRAQRLALLARDLVGAGDDVVEAVELVDPLRGVALADAGDAGQVVGGLADDRRELGIAVGRDAVLLLDVGRGEPGQVAHAAHRVEHGGVLGDQLDGVAVAGEDQHLHALGERLGDEGGDDVVGLVALERRGG